MAVIAVYTNTTDYYYCTVVHMNSTKGVHADTIIIVYTDTIDYYYCTVGVGWPQTVHLSLVLHAVTEIVGSSSDNRKARTATPTIL